MSILLKILWNLITFVTTQLPISHNLCFLCSLIMASLYHQHHYLLMTISLYRQNLLQHCLLYHGCSPNLMKTLLYRYLRHSYPSNLMLVSLCHLHRYDLILHPHSGFSSSAQIVSPSLHQQTRSSTPPSQDDTMMSSPIPVLLKRKIDGLDQDLIIREKSKRQRVQTQ